LAPVKIKFRQLQKLKLYGDMSGDFYNLIFELATLYRPVDSCQMLKQSRDHRKKFEL